MASVKLSDIAQKLNTSTVTVSNAINGKGAISAELRSKILQTAQEMGYQKRTKPKESAPQAARRDPLAPLLQTITPAPASSSTPEAGAAPAKAGPKGAAPAAVAPTNSAPAGTLQPALTELASSAPIAPITVTATQPRLNQ